MKLTNDGTRLIDSRGWSTINLCSGSEEGSFKLERPGYEHDPPQTFLEPLQVNVVCICRLPSPPYEPLGPSLRDAQVSGSMEKFETDPDHSVHPLLPLQPSYAKRAGLPPWSRAQRKPSTPGGNVHPRLQVEVVGNNHMPSFSLIRRQILG